LGISGNLEKQKVVKEVQILAELKKIKVNFGTEIPSEEDRKELVERKEIYLILDQKDKLGNFCPELVF
jgi:hypothetical protein